MIKYLKKLFSKTKPWNPQRIINMWEHKSWGNNIGWYDWKTRRISGHLTPKPEIDDEIRARLASGRTGRFRVVSIEHVKGVHDMFWATVSDIGYLETQE